MAVDIDIQQVDHTFQDKTGRLAALHQLDLRIQSGEFVSLVGPSGCGKSTLLRLVAGLITPSQGQILLGGRAAAVLRAQKEIGWMAQQAALLPWLTVLANVRLPLQVNRQAGRPHASPEELLAMVGLADFAGYYPATLSGGMQQRVALARTLATGASLWLMDEPFAALDELTRESLGAELLRIWGRFRPTVVWVTHHLPEAVRLSDRVVILSMRPGRILADIAITLPRPRDDTAPEFQAIVRQARKVIMNGEF
jgi:NitT/TauT family transport system ATP-binding protein